MPVDKLYFSINADNKSIEAIVMPLSVDNSCVYHKVYQIYCILSCLLNLILMCKQLRYGISNSLKTLKLNLAYTSHILFLLKGLYCFLKKQLKSVNKLNINTVKNILNLRILLLKYAAYMHFTCYFALCRIHQNPTYSGKRYIKLLTIYQKPGENGIADAIQRHFTKVKYLSKALLYILYRSKQAIVSSTIAYLPRENTYCQSHYSYFTKVTGLLKAQLYSNYLRKTAICFLNKWQCLYNLGFACHFLLPKPNVLANIINVLKKRKELKCLQISKI